MHWSKPASSLVGLVEGVVGIAALSAHRLATEFGPAGSTTGAYRAETSATAKTRNRTLGLGGTVPLGASVDLILAHYRVKRTRTAAVDDGFNRSVAFLEYKLSKRTRAYAELDQTRWKNGYQGAGFKSSASGVSAGVVHSF